MSRAGEAAGVPALALHDHQASEVLDLQQITSVMQKALPLILSAPGPETSVLRGLDEIEVSFLDDTGMARVHGEFLGDSTPTDVITFHHGEVLISAETAAREATMRGTPVSREVTLYLIHGLLHLHGYADQSEAGRALMHETQERILDTAWPSGDARGSPLPPASG